jgi:D-alanine-D-alanine ligase
VKPANGGSSVGVTKVRSAEDLGEAMRVAAAYDRTIVVERALDGREIECSVLGNDTPEASPPGEILPDREFYDYESKYSGESKTELRIPAPIDDATAQQVRDLAVRAFRAVGCSGMARVDFFLLADGTLYVNEINTIPGFTPISMYPKLWEAAGLSYQGLITKLIELALERFEEREAYAEAYAARH